MSVRVCWLAAFGRMELGDPMAPCQGDLVRCHLIPQGVLRRHGAEQDPRGWVWGCGGPTGLGGHHGMLDHSRTLRLPRAALPEGTEQLARELDLEWWLDRTYGRKDE